MLKNKRFLTTREIAVFAMLGALMFVGDIAFEWAMNVHPITMLLVAYTVCYRKKGIIPFAVYVLLQAAFFGGLWLVPYCYIFPLCWAFTLAVPTKMPIVARQICYSVICAFFGFAFGALYAPWHMIVYMKSVSFEKLIAWIISGFPADVLHGFSNVAASFLIFPIVNLIKKIDGKFYL